MHDKQLARITTGKGFIAALDQSGGSTPKALRLYGVEESSYHSPEEMFTLVHEMRKRIMLSPAFTSDRVLGAILFEDTLSRNVDGAPTATFLWEGKGVIPFLKIDQGLQEQRSGVQLMKPIPGLAPLLKEAVDKKVFGTKMRSVIKEPDERGIAEIVEQQFSVAAEVMDHGLIPILEPEIDIFSPSREESETLLLREVKARLAALPAAARLMFKFSLPVRDNFYQDLLADPHVLRIVALSGGYSREEANTILARNHGLIASFSRALTQGLRVDQDDAAFNALLDASIESIYQASLT